MALKAVTKVDSPMAFIEENVRIIDACKHNDRYTAVLMHKVLFKSKSFECLCMSADPHADGGVIAVLPGRPGKHLGDRISFQDLPPPCQDLLIDHLF